MHLTHERCLDDGLCDFVRFIREYPSPSKTLRPTTASQLSRHVVPTLPSYHGSGSGSGSGAGSAGAGAGSSRVGLGFISAYDDDDDDDDDDDEEDDNGSSTGSHDRDYRARDPHAASDVPAPLDPASKRRKPNATSESGVEADFS